MKTLGLIGGMSWESTQLYYRIINEAVRERLGGHHSAPLVLASLDFAPLHAMQHAGDWEGVGAVLADAARRLERAGAEGLVLCTNTMHKLADRIEVATPLPLLHVVDLLRAELARHGVRRVGLLGTRFTMEQDFYRERLSRDGGPAVLVPDADGRELVNRVIFDELVQGRVEAASRQGYLAVIEALVDAGAEAVILGCTEIGLLVADGDAAVPLLDSTTVHARHAAAWCMDTAG